jgi:hypothetical protein
MPRHGRRDVNHADVRDPWRALLGKHNVLDTADLGYAFGDLVLGVRGVTVILEVKANEKAPLTPGQEAQMALWRGGPWLRVNGFADSLDKVNEALVGLGLGPVVLSSRRASRA